MRAKSGKALHAAQVDFEKVLAKSLAQTMGADWKTAVIPSVLVGIWVDKNLSDAAQSAFDFSREELELLDDYFLKKMLFLEFAKKVPGLEAPITAFCLAGYGRFVMQVAYTRAETPEFFGPECAQFLAHAWSAAEDDMWNGQKVFTLLERGLNGGRAPAPPPTKKVKRPVDDAEAAQSQDTVDTPSPLAPRTARAEGNGAELNDLLVDLRGEIDRLRRAHRSTDKVVDDVKAAARAVTIALLGRREDERDGAISEGSA